MFIFNFLIFPGFLFTAFVGLIASWVDRKITARLQWRVGPPWHQPFIDIVKLMGKETLLPSSGSRTLFLLAPLLGFASVILVSTFIWIMNLFPERRFIGDLIVVLYLLTVPALSVILGGFASGNSLASIGASREMKLVLAYELPFVLAVLCPVIKSKGIISVGGLVDYQFANGAFALSLSGGLALIVAILCMQAKLGLVPFDIAEAETEIIGGPFIEYSGAPLAILKLTKSMLLFTVPVVLITFFMGGIRSSGSSIVLGVLKYVVLLVVVILIRNTNPRIRIDHALRFFWGPVLAVAVIAVVLALSGF